jgi:all-trans-retinol 13,14-reductase
MVKHSGVSLFHNLESAGFTLKIRGQHFDSGFRRHGIYFDSGFHYAGGAGAGGPLCTLLQHLGVADRLELFPYTAEGFDRLYFSDLEQEYTLPVGFAAIRQYLREQFPDAAGEIEIFLDEVEFFWRRVPYLDLDLNLSDFGMESVHGMSLQQRLAVFSAWPQLQSLLSMHSLLYGVSPGQAPLSLNAQVAGSYYHSAHGIVGGGKSLINSYMAVLQEAGVDIRCNSRVESILATAGVATGVRLATGEELSGAEVIATVNPGQLPQLLPAEGIRPAYRKRLSGLQQTMSAYIVFARSDESLEFLLQQNIFVQPGAGIFSAGSGMALEKRPFYLAGADQGGGWQNKRVDWNCSGRLF